MRVDFLGHATLLIRHGALTLLTDPWWSGPAYAGQWYPYPLPVPERYDLRQVDAVYVSHAHEDHLHAETLREVLRAAPTAQALIPRRYDTQMRDYLRRIGFRRIREVPSGTPLTLRKRGSAMRLTLITHMDDSLMAVEADGEVLVNANDALHASRRDLIDEYCRILRRRFPRIHFLFCAYGGASYFPNCFHVPGKDDHAVATAREAFFLRNFALITHQLQPAHAFPFAAHFVLPEERTWWISALRLQAEPPSHTIGRFLGESATSLHDLQPGDFVDSSAVHVSPPAVHDDVEHVRYVVLARYPSRTERPALAADDFEDLVHNVRTSIARHTLGAAERLDAVIALVDVPAQAIHVAIEDGTASVAGVERSAVDRMQPELVFETHSDLLKRTMRSPFGRDLISIGYGAEVRIRSQRDMQRGQHERLLALLAPPQPRWRHHFRKHPLRTLGFVVGDPSMRYALAGRLLERRRRRRPVAPEPGLYELGDWALLAQSPE